MTMEQRLPQIDRRNRPVERLDTEDTCQVRRLHPERIEQAHGAALPRAGLERLALMYRILADPTRLRIVMALRQGEMCVCDLAAFLGVTDSAVSHQLRRLKDLALVTPRRDGQVLYYSLNDAHVEELLRVGLSHVLE